MKTHPLTNTGLIEKAPSDTAWLAGAETGIKGIVMRSDGQWDKYLPTDERQKNSTFESNLCVTFSGHNGIESVAIYMNRAVAEKRFTPETIKKITDLGFLDEYGKFNCNEMFSARMNGSSPNGNNLEAFWESVRKNGLLPQKMWKDIHKDIHSFDELYNTPVPPELITYAKKILEVIDFNYQWVLVGKPNDAKLREYLQYSPLHIASPVCGTWNHESVGVCYAPDGTLITRCAHATMIYGYNNEGFKILDHYVPFKKILETGYYIPFAIGFSITERTVPPDNKPQYNFYRVLEFGMTGPDVVALQNILIYEGLLNAKLNTGNFGQNTKDAVCALQLKYSDQILKPIGLTAPTGKVARMTIMYLNSKYGKSRLQSLLEWFTAFFQQGPEES
jgi:hypothetical protein